MKNFVELKKVLLGGASVVAVGMFMGPALAQAQLETVVVTGIRASLSSAQSIKQNSDQVVDSITAVDIGALPDRNVADALQRVPGVTLQRTDQARDPVRYGGTGNNVFIRGLSWVSNLTNGRDTFSAVNGRSLSFADVAADLLSGVDVYKNPTASMIEGGIGGTVDLRTRKPFDQENRVIAFSADYTYGDLINKGTPSANVVLSDRWNTGIGEIGALVSVDWQDQRNRTNGISVNWYGCDQINYSTTTHAFTSSYNNAQTAAGAFSSCQATPVAPASLATTTPTANGSWHLNVPNYGGYRGIDWQQQRFATDIALQWRPNEKLEFTFEALNAIANPHDTEYAAGISISTGLNDLAGYTYAADGTWTGGNVHNVGYAFDTRIGKHHNRTTDISLTAKYNPNDNWEFRFGAAFTESIATNYSLTGYTSPDTSKTDVLFKFNTTGDTATVTSSSAGLATKANYGWLAMMDHMEDNFAHSFSFNADGSYKFHGNGMGWLSAIDFGFRASMKQAITRQTGYNWAAVSPGWGTGWGPQYLDNTRAAGMSARFATPSAELLSASTYHNFGDFLGGSVPSLWFMKASVLDHGMAAAYDTIKTAENAWWFWQPYSIQNGCTTVDIKCYAAYTGANPAADNVTAGVNNQKEDTYAGYLQVDYSHETLLGLDVPVDGNIGVRIVRTENTADAGKLVINSLTTDCTPGNSIVVSGVPYTLTTADCADFTTAHAFVGSGGRVNLPARTNGYTDILPSFNFRAHVTDQVQARLAFSQSMVRPEFKDTTNFAQVSFTFYGAPSRDQGRFNAAPSGSGGNVGLKPMKANNFDASLEWYFAPTGSVTFSLFHKDISNYFFSTSVPVPVTNPTTGKTMTFNMVTMQNGQKGKVEGFELAYQQFYDSLPGAWGGLGFQANYTKIYNSGGANPTVNPFDPNQVGNSSRNLPMEGMSPDSFNLALLYEKYGISARMAYNWRSRYLLTSSAANLNQPVWSANYGQLDGSILYTFLDNYKIGLQVTNISKAPTTLYVGYADFYRKYNWIDTDRKYSLILRTSW